MEEQGGLVGDVRKIDPLLDVITDGAWAKALLLGTTQAAGLRAVGYGPGRGAFVDGQWVLCFGHKGPGGDAKQIDRKQRATLFCSALTNLLAAYALGVGAKFNPLGAIPLIWMLLQQKEWRVLGPPVLRGDGFAGKFKPLRGNGGKWVASANADFFRGEDLVKALLEKSANDPDHSGIFLFAQSPDPNLGRLNFHHVGIFVVRPEWPDRVFRVAADGYKRQGRYSGTPINVEVIKDATKPGLVHMAWGLKRDHLVGSSARVVREGE